MKIIICKLCDIEESDLNKSDTEAELKTAGWIKINEKNICPNCVSDIFNSQYANAKFRQLIRRMIQEELKKCA